MRPPPLMFVEAQVPGPVVQCLHDLRNGQAVGRLRPDLNAVYVVAVSVVVIAGPAHHRFPRHGAAALHCAVQPSKLAHPLLESAVRAGFQHLLRQQRGNHDFILTGGLDAPQPPQDATGIVLLVRVLSAVLIVDLVLPFFF